MHPFWFPPPTQAAIALQTHLAHPPPTSWPCATTPTSSSIDSTSITLLCTGPAPIPPTPPAHYSVTWGNYLCTLMHPCAPFAHLAHLQRTLRAPSAHPCAPFCAPFPGLATHIGPSHQPQTPLATLGNPASAQPGTAPPQTSVESSPNHLAPIWAIHFTVGWLNPLSHPRTLSSQVTIAKVAPLLTVVSPVAGSHTSLSHGPWVGKFFFLGKTPTCCP